MRYRISLPNDYGSATDDAALLAAYAGLEGEDIEVAAFEDLYDLWKGLRWVGSQECGIIAEADTPMPEGLPSYYWITEIEV